MPLTSGRELEQEQGICPVFFNYNKAFTSKYSSTQTFQSAEKLQN